MMKLFVIIFLFFSTTLLASKIELTVVSVKGDVYVRRPDQQLWYKVQKNRKLQMGWLLQIMPNSEVRISFKSKGKIVEENILQLNDPTVLRLHAHLLRKKQDETFNMLDLPELNEELSEADVEQSAIPWVSAWKNTVMGYINPESIGSIKDPNDLLTLRNEVQSSKISKTIRLYSPRVNHLLRVPFEPFVWHVKWQSLKNQKYLLYVWEATKKMGNPVAVTDNNSYAVPLKHGLYFFKVKTVDGTAESSTHLLQLMPTLGVANQLASNTEDVFPKLDQIIETQKEAEVISFNWSNIKNVAKTNTDDQFIVAVKQNEVVVAQKQVQGYEWDIALPVGKYSWSVSAAHDKKELLLHNFSITKEIDILKLLDPKQTGNVSVYLTNGL